MPQDVLNTVASTTKMSSVQTTEQCEDSRKGPSADSPMQHVRGTSASAGVCGGQHPLPSSLQGSPVSAFSPGCDIVFDLHLRLGWPPPAPCLTLAPNHTPGNPCEAQLGAKPVLSGYTFRNLEVVTGGTCVPMSPVYYLACGPLLQWA